MIPLLHDFDGETVLVFGGGSVGARRARTFAAEAEVVVISPTFVDELDDAALDRADGIDDAFGGADRLEAAPSPDRVAGWIDRFEPALVVAATDDEAVNDAVAVAARERGILLNRADRSGDREPGDVAVPSIVRSGDVVVGISTGVPALTRELRRRIEDAIGRPGGNAGEMAALARELRADLREEYDAGSRRAAIRAVVRDSSVWTALDTGRTKARQVADGVVRDAVEDNE